MFVKWECGCVGLLLKEGNIIIKDCTRDKDSDEFCFRFEPGMNKGKVTPLDENEIIRLTWRIDKLIAAGHRLGDIKFALDLA